MCTEIKQLDLTFNEQAQSYIDLYLYCDAKLQEWINDNIGVSVCRQGEIQWKPEHYTQQKIESKK